MVPQWKRHVKRVRVCSEINSRLGGRTSGEPKIKVVKARFHTATTFCRHGVQPCPMADWSQLSEHTQRVMSARAMQREA